MKNKILIFGKGFIGERVHLALGGVLSPKRILTFRDVQKEVDRVHPKVIINCVGHTGKGSVDDCEKDPDKTLFANTYVPLLLAEAAYRRKIKLVHISSGCIYHFDYRFDKPLTENDPADFLDLYYSRSKIYAERGLEVLFPGANILIVRIRIPLDDRKHPRNILTKIIRYKNVIDLPNSVTYIPDFIEALKHLLKVNARGIYNVVNKGGLRYPQLLDIYKRFDPQFQYRKIPLKKLGLVRTNLLLSVAKLEKSGFKMRSIKEALEECVKRYVRS